MTFCTLYKEKKREGRVLGISEMELGLSFRPKMTIRWRGGCLGNVPGAIEMGNLNTWKECLYAHVCLCVYACVCMCVEKSCVSSNQLPLSLSSDAHKTRELESLILQGSFLLLTLWVLDHIRCINSCTC